MDHIEELRRRLIVSAMAVFLMTAFLFSFDWDGRWPTPALEENLAARLFLAISADLLPATVTLIVAKPIDGFAAEMSIAIGASVLLTSPIWVWQVGGFFWPALQPREQRIVLQAFVPMVLLFVAGVAFGYLVVLPFLFETLYAYGTALGAQPFLLVADFVTFSIGMLLVFGVAFQTPLVMWALTRIGLVKASTWRKYWRHAIVAIAILAALVTDPTVVSQIMVAVPLMGLYGLGAGLAVLAQRKT